MEDNKTIKEGAHCLLQHLETYRKQAIQGEIANFAKPCSECLNMEDCKGNWLKKIEIFNEKYKLHIIRCCSTQNYYQKREKERKIEKE